MRIEPDTINILNTLNKPDVFTVFIYSNGFDVILRVSENNNFDKKNPKSWRGSLFECSKSD